MRTKNRPADPRSAGIYTREKLVCFSDGGDGFAYAETPYGKAIIDSADIHRVDEINWYWKPPKGTHSARLAGFAGGRTVDLGRFIIKANTTDMFVDHINRDALDNRRINLRFCSYSQNRQNSPGSPTRKCIYKGVSKCRGRWCAAITKQGKKFRLGAFSRAIDAAKAYDEAAIRIHGEFACTNASLGLL